MSVVKKLEKHKLLLDTHIWIYLMEGDEKLSSSFIKNLDEHLDEGRILISAISIWEVGMLEEKKKITLKMDCLDWVEQSLDSPQIEVAPISPGIAIHSSRLPGEIHGDPADRILVATAYENNAVLVTHDDKILSYGKDRFIGVHDPRKG